MAIDKAVDSAALDAGLTDIADAIRLKSGKSDTMAFSNGFIAEIDNLRSPNGVWIKPDGWPDIESVALPDNEKIAYLLYDKKCGFDNVQILLNRNAGVVEKGTIINGRFVGEVVATNPNPSFNDVLTDEYTVYRLTGLDFFKLGYSTANNYPSSLQSVVWVYMSHIDAVGGPGKDSSAWSIHTKRFKSINKNMSSENILTESPFYTGSFVMSSNTVNGDCGGVETYSRVGNGPTMYNLSDSDGTLVVKNINAPTSALTGGKFNWCRNVVFDNVKAKAEGNYFQNAYYLKSVVFNPNCQITVTSMYYWFNNCRMLETCDLSALDFSAVTSTGAAFVNDGLLKTLKLNNTFRESLNLNSCFSLSRESILGLIHDLPEIDTAKTLTLPWGAKQYLVTADELAELTAKGWTVA